MKKLEDALAGVEYLSGLLPICTDCKKIRDENENWVDIDSYLVANSDLTFTHTVCPECLDENYSKYNNKPKKKD